VHFRRRFFDGWYLSNHYVTVHVVDPLIGSSMRDGDDLPHIYSGQLYQCCGSTSRQPVDGQHADSYTRRPTGLHAFRPQQSWYDADVCGPPVSTARGHAGPNHRAGAPRHRDS